MFYLPVIFFLSSVTRCWIFLKPKIVLSFDQINSQKTLGSDYFSSLAYLLRLKQLFMRYVSHTQKTVCVNIAVCCRTGCQVARSFVLRQ